MTPDRPGPAGVARHDVLFLDTATTRRETCTVDGSGSMIGCRHPGPPIGDERHQRSRRCCHRTLLEIAPATASISVRRRSEVRANTLSREPPNAAW
jgi:hypothetical protein